MRQLSLFSQTKTLARAGAEGQLYVKDVDLYYGDTSGTEIRLTAGGQPVNGGTVTINIGGGSVSSPLSTKGDIWVFGSADTALPVGAGTDGYVLTADSAEATGLKWAAVPSGAATVAAALPTAGTTYRGKLYILEATGQPDKVYMCVRFSGGSYDWVEITRAI